MLLFLVQNIFSFLCILATLRQTGWIHDHSFASLTRWRRPFELILHLESNDSVNLREKFLKLFFSEKKFCFLYIVCVYACNEA